MPSSREILLKVFPRTLAELRAAQQEYFVQDFLQSDFSDKLHFFPMFLKSSKVSLPTQEVAHYESLQWSLQGMDFSLSKSDRQESPVDLQLNPSFQWLELGAGALLLGKKPGVYGLWKNAKSELEEIALDPIHGALLELMELERRFNFDQLVEFQLNEAGNIWTLEQLRMALQELCQLEIILNYRISSYS